MSKSPHGYDTRSWNPVTGCSKVSAGCRSCWAEEYSRRMGWPWKVTLHPERLEQPFGWPSSQVVALCFMSDIFHEDIPYEFQEGVWRVMMIAQQHTFLALTKRIKPRVGYAMDHPIFRLVHDYGVLPNVFLGVSVENQATADERIPLLLETPAAHRWVSAEPLLGPLNLEGPADGRWLVPDHNAHWERGHVVTVADLAAVAEIAKAYCRKEGWAGIDGVIVGGESGAGHRPMEVAWAQSIVGQCDAAGVPVYVKQDSHRYPGRQGRIPDALWTRKQVPWEPAL